MDSPPAPGSESRRPRTTAASPPNGDQAGTGNIASGSQSSVGESEGGQHGPGGVDPKYPLWAYVQRVVNETGASSSGSRGGNIKFNQLLGKDKESLISAPKQPRCLPLVLGCRNILELVGDEPIPQAQCATAVHGHIDAEVVRHLDGWWTGRRAVAVMKLLTFDIIGTLPCGLDHAAAREQLPTAFADMLEGMWSVTLELRP
ncbi:hypothetical protein ZWY2020_003319 [Hordeum vulgare]|nr:hypothetical protein ZWY2020_003319 [Hordeum vulgare]